MSQGADQSWPTPPISYVYVFIACERQVPESGGGRWQYVFVLMEGLILLSPLSKELYVHPLSTLNPVNSPFFHQYLSSPVA